MAKAQTTSENPQGEVSQQDTPVLPMQYDVRIHSIQFDGPCRATASLKANIKAAQDESTDMDTLNALSQLESAFGSHSLKKKLAEDAVNSAAGGLVFGLPAGVLGIISLVQKRGGRGMAIASLVIGGINLLLILGLFGLSLE